jgi:predicted transposase YdaD
MQLSPLYLEKIQAAEQKGKLEDKQENRQEIALRMLGENIPLETIARITELSIDRLQVLRFGIADAPRTQLETN